MPLAFDVGEVEPTDRTCLVSEGILVPRVEGPLTVEVFDDLAEVLDRENVQLAHE